MELTFRSASTYSRLLYLRLFAELDHKPDHAQGKVLGPLD